MVLIRKAVFLKSLSCQKNIQKHIWTTYSFIRK